MDTPNEIIYGEIEPVPPGLKMITRWKHDVDPITRKPTVPMAKRIPIHEAVKQIAIKFKQDEGVTKALLLKHGYASSLPDLMWAVPGRGMDEGDQW